MCSESSFIEISKNKRCKKYTIHIDAALYSTIGLDSITLGTTYCIYGVKGLILVFLNIIITACELLCCYTTRA